MGRWSSSGILVDGVVGVFGWLAGEGYVGSWSSSVMWVDGPVVVYWLDGPLVVYW